MTTNPFEERVILEAKLEQVRRFREALKKFTCDFPKLTGEHFRCLEGLSSAAELAERMIEYELLKLGQIIGCK